MGSVIILRASQIIRIDIKVLLFTFEYEINYFAIFNSMLWFHCGQLNSNPGNFRISAILILNQLT